MSRAYAWLPWVTLAAATGWLAWFPLVPTDNDLFYHLSGGRYFAETGAIYADSFFSFLQPPRTFVVYFWLFQSLVFRLFESGGYHALLMLRASVFAGLFAVVLRFLWARAREGGSRLYLLSVFGLSMGSLFVRMANVRPHVFSYLFLALTIVLAESKRRYAVLALPLVTVLWANLHGIEFPVLLLVLGAYFAETLVSGLKERWSQERLVRLAALGLSPLGLLFTPHGGKLLAVPFRWLGLAPSFILELRRPVLEDVTTLAFERGLLTAPAFLGLLLVLIAGSLFAGAIHRRLRLSHVLLVAGGLVLLSQGLRFRNELMLLALPLLRAQAPRERERLSPAFGLLACVVVLGLPVGSYIHSSGPRGLYPLSRNRTHTGIAAFLKKVDLGGTILNHPNWGGHLAWELYPRYRIAADLQSPFMFDEEDIYLAERLFFEPALFARWQSTYQPDFVVVPLEAKGFGQIAAGHPQYQQIFFDDAGVLYVDASKHPKLAEQYSLGRLDPLTLPAGTLDPLPPELADELAPALERVAEIDPNGRLVNKVLFAAREGKGEWEAALGSARAAIAGWPNVPDGYELEARALFSLGRLREAERSYRKAIELSVGSNPRLHSGLGRTLARLDEWDEAFEALREGLDVYAGEVSVEELELLGVAAGKSGHQTEARYYLRFAELRSEGAPNR